MPRLRTSVSEDRSQFAMIEKQALANLDELMKQDIQAARLIITLIGFLEPNSGGVVIVSKNTMAELLGVSTATISRALRTLIAGKWVHRTRVGTAHAIAVNDTVAWVGARSQRQYSVFSATVIASRSEQSEADLLPRELKKLPIVNQSEEVVQSGEALPPSQGILDGLELAATKGERRITEDQLSLLDGD